MRYVRNDTRKAIVDHANLWSKCEGCELSKSRTNVALYRGYIPSPLLLIGEAPGRDEDREGLPFVGISGEELDAWIKQSFDQLDYRDSPTILPPMAFANVISCIPLDEKNNIRLPSQEEMDACSGRLQEFISISKASVIVAVGDIAAKRLKSIQRSSSVQHLFSITHPARVLRAGRGEVAELRLQAITQLREAITLAAKIGI